jgi:hypothetical protein
MSESRLPTFPVAVEVGVPQSSRTAVEGRLERVAAWLRPRLPWVHGLMFAAFLLLIAAPVLLPTGPLSTRLAGLANQLIWGLWFPLVFLSVLVSGRSWCGLLCPMGAASQWMNQVGPKRPVPAWLRWEGTPIVSFVLVTVLGQTVGVRDYPGALLEVFGATLVAALIIGFLYGRGHDKRAWCRHACPIGLLLGVFSRLGMVDLVPKRLRAGGDAYVEKGLCPTMIDINRKTESRHCIMCMRCVQPGRRGGLSLRLRTPGAEVAAIRDHHPALSEFWFMLLGTGVALGGFLWLVLPQYQWLRQHVGAWAIDRGWYWIGQPGPGWLMVFHPEAREVFVWLDFILIVSWMLAVMALLTAILGGLNAAAVWLAGKLGAKGPTRERFTELGYQFAPVAMISLLLGLGGELFGLLPAVDAALVKSVLLAAAWVWGAVLGRHILIRQGLSGWRVVAAQLPGLAGAGLVALAWWPALGGL